MMSDMENNFIVAKLNDGENLFDSLKRLTREYNIRSGTILSGIGMLRNFEIGFFNGERYIKEKIRQPYELIALHGSIATVNNKPSIHIHCGLAGPDHRLIGGHLFRAKVAVLNEITILKFDDMGLTRKKNKKSGIAELEILRE